MGYPSSAYPTKLPLHFPPTLAATRAPLPASTCSEQEQQSTFRLPGSKTNSPPSSLTGTASARHGDTKACVVAGTLNDLGCRVCNQHTYACKHPACDISGEGAANGCVHCLLQNTQTPLLLAATVVAHNKVAWRGGEEGSEVWRMICELQGTRC